MPDNSSQPPVSKMKRTVFFTILCIVGLVINGILTLVSIGGIFLAKPVSEAMEKYAPGYGSAGKEWMIILSIILLLIFGSRLLSVIIMYLGRKIGYIFYLVPSGILLIAEIVVIFATYSLLAIGIFSAGILFVFLYGTFIKYMR